MSFSKDQLIQGETVVLLTHQHPIVLLRPILLDFVSIIVLLGISITLGNYWLLLFYIAPTLYLGWEILSRQRMEHVITNRRVVKQEGVFSIHSFDAPLDKINNVFHEQNLVGRLLKYGDVGLETASEQGTTIFQRIPDPVAFKNCIVHQREMYQGAGSRSSPTVDPRTETLRLLDHLAQLRDRKVITEAEFEEKKRNLLTQL